MKIGLNMVSLQAGDLVDAAVLAERLGFDSIWYGEHLLFPQDTHYPVGAEPYGPQELLDPMTVLAAVAACTTSIRLATGVLVLPLHAPVIAARQIVGVDVLSHGRLDLAVGVGWLKAEYDVAGTDMGTRGARADEMLQLINTLFSDGEVEHRGSFYSVPLTDFRPKPAQTPRPPFLVGGSSPAALKRAAMWDGWYGPSPSPEHAKRRIEKLSALREEFGRSDDPFQVVVVFHQGRPPGSAPPAEDLAAYLEAGVDRVVVTPWESDYMHALDHIAGYADSLGLR